MRKTIISFAIFVVLVAKAKPEQTPAMSLGSLFDSFQTQTAI